MAAFQPVIGQQARRGVEHLKSLYQQTSPSARASKGFLIVGTMAAFRHAAE